MKRMSTASKADIPEGERPKSELLYLHEIVSLVEELNMPSRLLMNLDQTNFKYMLVAYKMLLQVSRIFFFNCKFKTL